MDITRGKLRALGRSLAAASEDRARIDAEALFMEAVSHLTSQHMRFVNALLELHNTEEGHTFNEPQIESRAGVVDDAEAWMSGLVAAGVASVRHEGRVPVWWLSQLGYRLVFRARGWNDYDI